MKKLLLIALLIVGCEIKNDHFIDSNTKWNYSNNQIIRKTSDGKWKTSSYILNEKASSLKYLPLDEFKKVNVTYHLSCPKKFKEDMGTIYSSNKPCISVVNNSNWTVTDIGMSVLIYEKESNKLITIRDGACSVQNYGYGVEPYSTYASNFCLLKGNAKLRDNQYEVWKVDRLLGFY